MSSFEMYAVQRVLDQAREAGVEVPSDLARLPEMCGGDTSYAGMKWAELHPDADEDLCCWGAIHNGPGGCLCWKPVYDVEQADPQPPTRPEDLAAAPAMCHDCAFKPDSPERADDFTAEALYDSARSGIPFWCHQGMRKPDRWVHPDGREVEGSPDDWTPPKISGIPYRADGSPGLLCAGWTAVAGHAARGTEREDNQAA